MHSVTKENVVAALIDVGVKPGDGLLVHSALQYLGHPIGGVSIYLQALLDVLGPDGTVVAPTFNFGFARGEPYDPHTTPSEGMGVFSEYLRQQREARRTSHPIQSLSVVGHFSGDLSKRETSSAFEAGSAFERMLELKFKILLLGASIDAISMLHYSEQRLGVPYRYWKEFSGLVLIGQGWQRRTYRMYVRDLELDPRLTLQPVQEILQSRRQWATIQLNYGWISLCSMTDFVTAVDELLAQDPWSLVTNRPSNQ